MALRAAIFAFDGVIVDSEPLHYRSLRDALRPEGVEISEQEYLRIYLAYDDREAIRLALEHHGESADPARVDRIEFRASLTAPAIAEGIRSGSLDIARDLLPQDLEAILREPAFRSGLVETPKKNTYFVIFHTGSAAGSNATLRQALASAANGDTIKTSRCLRRPPSP